MRSPLPLGCALALLAAPLPASAAVCAPSLAELTATLAHSFQEAPAWSGVSSTGELLQLYASPKGTWTVALAQAEGPACILRTGSAGEAIPVGVPA